MFESHPSWDLEKIRDLFRAAGEIALEYFDAPPTELKSDQTVVTLADKKIEKLFASVLDVPANDSYMIGEETECPACGARLVVPAPLKTDENDGVVRHSEGDLGNAASKALKSRTIRIELGDLGL